MNYQIVTGSTGTSISLSFIEVYGNATPAAAATGPKYQHFDAKQNNGQLTPQQAADLSQQAKAIQQSIGCSNIWGDARTNFSIIFTITHALEQSKSGFF